MVCRNQAAGAGHIPRNHIRSAGNVFSHVARHQARVDVGGARGWITNDEVDCLAPVELFHGLSAGRTGDEQGYRENTSEALRPHLKGSDLSRFENISEGRKTGIAGLLTGHFLAPQFSWMT